MPAVYGGLAGPKFRQVLFAGGPNANAVDAYTFSSNPPAEWSVTDELAAPTGMALDHSDNLYVCNNAGRSARGKSVYWTVTVYRNGHNRLLEVYTDGVASPVDVAVARDYTVYIANFSNGSGVTVYPPQSLHPSRTLRGPSGYTPLGVAVSTTGDVFVSWIQPYGGGGRVYRYKDGHTHGVDLGITFDGEPHGLTLDSTGNLIVAVSKAPSPGSDIEVFAPGKTQPKKRITGPFQPFMIALTRNDKNLFVADYGTGNNDGGVFVYTYPAGQQLFEDTQGAAAGAYGIAVRS